MTTRSRLVLRHPPIVLHRPRQRMREEGMTKTRALGLLGAVVALLLATATARAQSCCVCRFCGTNVPNVCFSGILDSVACGLACEGAGCSPAKTSSEPCSSFPECDDIRGDKQVAPLFGPLGMGVAVLAAALGGVVRQIGRRRRTR